MRPLHELLMQPESKVFEFKCEEERAASAIADSVFPRFLSNIEVLRHEDKALRCIEVLPEPQIVELALCERFDIPMGGIHQVAGSRPESRPVSRPVSRPESRPESRLESALAIRTVTRLEKRALSTKGAATPQGFVMNTHMNPQRDYKRPSPSKACIHTSNR